MKPAVRSSSLRILCLTPHNLDAPAYGGVLRAQNLFRLLARIGTVRVVLAGSCNADAGTKSKSSLGGFELAGVAPFHAAPLQSVADHLRYEFDGRFLNTDKAQASINDREWLQQQMAQHDLVWIHGLRTANGFGRFRWPHSVLDVDDIPSSVHRTNLAHAKNVFDRIRYFRRMLRWRRREKLLLERFDALCVCSEPDRLTLGGSDRIFVLPNGANPPQHPPLRRPTVPPRIGFVGILNYPPNQEGVRWFLQQVWPRILETVPQARLRLVGTDSEKPMWRNQPNVEGLGWIADLESEMATWSLAIVPVLFGGGTRIKIVEAFSRRCPVVSTTLGAYGFDAADGREILLADSANDFAVKCLRLLADPAVGQTLVENAWQKFLAHWTWDSFASRVAGVVESMLQKPRPSP